MFVAFVSNFRESSINACKNSLNRFLQTANKTAADKISSICTCATERVAGTMTVGEARAASASALIGSMTENP